MLCAVLAGCASAVPRVPFTASEQTVAEVVGLKGVRAWTDGPSEGRLEKWLPPTREITMLALSGGSDSGAYGAGFLNGWSASGARPSFSIVSGVSTGALIAPFAFLGPAYDPVLRSLYTQTSASDVFTVRPVVAGLFGSSFADTSPLQRRISELVTPELLAAIAREHARGRRLYVITTNLDAQRAVIWNMGEIASRPHPNSLAVFRQVLLASAAVPGLFAPVLIDVEAGGRRFQEMHADGGTITQFLSVTERLLVGSRPLPRGISLTQYVLINKKLAPEFAVVDNKTLQIVSRGFATIIKANTRSSVLNTFNYARHNRVRLRLTYIGTDFTLKDDKPFDPGYMRALFDYGYRQGVSGTSWIDASHGRQGRVFSVSR